MADGPVFVVGAARSRRGRRDGARLGPRYLEGRYEELIADPIAVLSSVCGHLSTKCDPGMLDYVSMAPERLRQGTTRLGQLHERTVLPPTTPPDRFSTLLEHERRAVEHACRPVLRALGYGTGDAMPSDAVRSWAGWGAGAVRRIPQLAADLARPGRRML